MQIEKQNSSDLAQGLAAVPTARTHDPRIAQRHLVALPARLALMRWTRGGDIPHIPATGRDVAKRAAWYGRMQQDFQDWLAAGGFHQNEPGQGAPK